MKGLKPMQWEYQIVTSERDGLDSNMASEHDGLNELGKNGWDFVSVVYQPSDVNWMSRGRLLYFLKRPIT
jgi:hypothetical protein